MESVFLKLINMSITAGYSVISVLILRIVLKKAPKWINVLLWAFVAIRLVCPFSFVSIFSLIPSADTIRTDVYNARPYVHTGINGIDNDINGYLGDHYFEGVTVPVDNTRHILLSAAVIWIIGMICMLLYMDLSYSKIRKRVDEGVLMRENIYLCDRIETPFILGIFRPHIYLPFTMSQQDMEYVISHEKAHLRRWDHIWKPMGFFLLTVYWFNPLLWVAYIMLCRDIELACDERVIRRLGVKIKKPYSEALINCSVPRRAVSACPLSFGEVGIRIRIKKILSYKKPSFWIIVIASVMCIVAALCLLTNPKVGDADGPANMTGTAYGYSYVSANDSSHLTLISETHKCLFSSSLLSSYFYIGTYEETDNYIVMTCEDNSYSYTFEKSGHNLIFAADKSSEMPKYKYSFDTEPAVCVPDRAEFKFDKK